MSNWLLKTKINSKDEFHNWLMDRVGFETYLRNKLWDSASLLHYIIVIRTDNLYLEYCKRGNNVIQFKPRT